MNLGHILHYIEKINSESVNRDADVNKQKHKTKQKPQYYNSPREKTDNLCVSLG